MVMRLRAFIDGAAKGNPGPAGIGVVILDQEGRLVMECGESIGVCTNNVAEYRSLLKALSLAAELGASSLEVYSDSELLVRQVLGQYRVKSQGLQPLFTRALEGLRTFSHYTVTHVCREDNAAADALASKAASAEARRHTSGTERRVKSDRRSLAPLVREESPDSTGQDAG
jgi:ribonuclease HI